MSFLGIHARWFLVFGRRLSKSKIFKNEEKNILVNLEKTKKRALSGLLASWNLYK
jgi:hypothetical protein